MEKSKIMDMDSYIAACPVEIQKTLQKLRKTIQISAPDATEKMSYAMPTFYLNGNLVHFAAYKNHIGFYPAPSGIEAFKKDLAKYKTSKGAIQFLIEEKLPFDLIEKIVKFRVIENKDKARLPDGQGQSKKY
jgi:uncharacterized protein YdhG (YjbR/CyaY superfamily)